MASRSRALHWHASFAFSIGLYHTLGHPEILVMGMPPGRAQQLINDVGETVRAGRRYEAGERCDGLVETYPLAFVAIIPPSVQMAPLAGSGANRRPIFASSAFSC